MVIKKIKKLWKKFDRFFYFLYSEFCFQMWGYENLEDTRHIKKLVDTEKVCLYKSVFDRIYEEAKKSREEGMERVMMLEGWYDEKNKIIYINGIVSHQQLEKDGKVPLRGKHYVAGSVWWEIVVYRERKGLREKGPIMLCHTHVRDLSLEEWTGRDKQKAGITKLPEMVVNVKDKLNVLIFYTKTSPLGFSIPETKTIPYEVLYD